MPRSHSDLVGRWTRPAGFPAVSPMFARAYAGAVAPSRGGEPDADALIVEAAILALGPAFGEARPPAELLEVLTSGVGARIDARGAYDAAAANAVNLVLAAGRLGRRPFAGAEKFEIRPKLAANGKPGVWRIERRPDDYGSAAPVDCEVPAPALRSGLYPPDAYCVILYEPDPQTIVNDRAEYLVWRLALEALAQSLSGKMETISALAPAAALAPWTGDRDGDRPGNLFAAGATGIYGKDQRREMKISRRASERRTPGAVDARPRRPARPGRSQAETG